MVPKGIPLWCPVLLRISYHAHFAHIFRGGGGAEGGFDVGDENACKSAEENQPHQV